MDQVAQFAREVDISFYFPPVIPWESIVNVRLNIETTIWGAIFECNGSGGYFTKIDAVQIWMNYVQALMRFMARKYGMHIHRPCDPRFLDYVMDDFRRTYPWLYHQFTGLENALDFAKQPGS